MAIIAGHLRAEVTGDSVAVGIIIISLSPHLHTPFPPLLPVPNKPYGFCGREAPCLLTYPEPVAHSLLHLAPSLDS